MFRLSCSDADAPRYWRPVPGPVRCIRGLESQLQLLSIFIGIILLISYFLSAQHDCVLPVCPWSMFCSPETSCLPAAGLEPCEAVGRKCKSTVSTLQTSVGRGLLPRVQSRAQANSSIICIIWISARCAKCENV